LIEEGFLCPITNKPADAEVNTEGIKLRGGEFIESEMQAVFVDNVDAACLETIQKCRDRRSILIFASGVRHAEDVAAFIEKNCNERVGLVTGDTLAIERAGLLAAFKSQELRWLVNCDVLTTGFNAKCVDAIAIMRATMSPGLFCQMVGRGLRLHPSKVNTLILDFGENIKRHGSIDDANFGRASEAKRGQAARAALNGRGKPCPACGIDVAANTRECECGYMFPVNVEGTSDGSSQLTGQIPPEVWTVVSVSYWKHIKRNDPDAPPTLRIDYECRLVESEGGLLTTKISEWVCLSHPPGFARLKAQGWWQNRSIAQVPDSVEEALSLLNRGACRMASQITTIKDGKYFRIQSCEFVDEIPTEWEEEIEEESFGEFSGVGDDVPF
jgi:DNA repair protein RadD